MLPDKLAHALKDLQQRLLNEGKLPTLDKLQGYYNTFRQKFGPEVLSVLEGETLLRTMHDFKRVNRNTLVYWLEFKNDEEFPYIFGSISGGSALKYGVYPDARTGVWKTRDASNYPIEITLTQAIEIAYRHRDQLLRGLTLLEKLPSNGSDADYQALQSAMDEQAPDVSRVAWGHKYFSLLYPDKLDHYHRPYYQRFHLVKLLQPNIPNERAGHYIAAGKFVSVARELDMPMNHLNSVLNIYNGTPYHFWSVLVSDARHPEAVNWEMQRNGGFAAIAWSELDKLSHLKHDNPSKKWLHEQMATVYPRVTSSQHQGVFDFVTDIAIGDRIVAYDSQTGKVVGVGKVTSDYYFEPSSAPHRRSVEWYVVEIWRFPSDEGFEKGTREVLIYANQVEIERHLLDAPVAKFHHAPEIIQSTHTVDRISREETLPSTLEEAVALIEEEDSISKIFISYRRRSWPFTHRLVDELSELLDAEIFVDYTGIDEADFERSILRNLRASDVVLLIVSEHTFEDRIHQVNDWVRREIREALQNEKPLLMVCVEARLPPPNLPDDIKDVSKMQGVNFYPEYFNDAVERLAQFVMRVGDVKARTTFPVPVSKISSTPPKSSVKIESALATLAEALSFMDNGEFSKAVPLLEALRETGYTSRNFDLNEVIRQAQIGADQEDVRRIAKSDYEEIVMLAARRVTLESARTAFARWCADNPSLVDELDTENLRQRFEK